VLAPNRTRRLPTVSATPADPNSPIPLIRPLALEVHWTTVAGREEAFWRWVTDDRPQISKKIEADTGVPVPLPSVSQNDSLADREFRVLVNEIPVARGHVEEGDGYAGIGRTIEDQLRNHLKALVGVDDIVRTLGELSDEDAETRDAVLNSDEAKMRVAQIVQRLIEERTHVDLAEVAHLLTDSDAADVNTVVQTIKSRRRLNMNGDEPVQRLDGRPSGPSWAVIR
jgi:type III secretory pathway component EscV